MSTKIFTVQLAFDAAESDREVWETISALLSDVKGLKTWQYTGVVSFSRRDEPPFGEANPDILRANADAIVIPVNTFGVPGAGLARQAAQRWPEWERRYRNACRSGDLRPGRVVAHHMHVVAGANAIIVDFPTKQHWRQKASLELIKDSLDALLDWLSRSGKEVRSIAIPAVGCGLGGLRWSSVSPLLKAFAMQVASDVRVDIYPPHVTCASVAIGNAQFWAVSLPDGTISEPPFSTPQDAVRAYLQGAVEWPDEDE